MPHYYEKNIVEIKNEYTDFLITILIPLLYEGIKSIYEKATKLEENFKQKELEDPSVKNPGVFKIFQICLRDIPNLNTASIESETNRIKERCKCSEYFDALLKGTIKSHIVLLTFNAKNKKSKIVEDRFHEKVDTNLFIHKCYIECSRLFFNYPELFWHNFSTLEIKKNQREIYELIKQAIHEAIRKTLPIKLILDEYLKNDYDYEDDLKSEKFVKVKKLLDKENNYTDSVPSIENKEDEDKDDDTNTGNSDQIQSSNGLTVNKIIDSDEEEELEGEMKKIESAVKESEKIEDEGDELMSQISNSVNINNLVLNTSVDENDIVKSNIQQNDFKMVNLKENGKKRNEASFFANELSRYKLSKIEEEPKPIQITSKNQISNTNNSKENIEMNIKKNNLSDKNEFFKSMLK
jgi:hypothetical protein